LRDTYEEIRDLGAEVVAIGTGTSDHVRDFVDREEIPYPVLSDDDGRAARAATIERVGVLRLFDPTSFPGGMRAWKAGHRIGTSGRRVNQLGATFVLEPGPRVRYAHRDANTADHAPIEEVLDALRKPAG
jgi:peroxiredoxin